MTRLYVDQSEIPVPDGVFASLGEALRFVEERHLAPRTLIRHVAIDGVPLGLELCEQHPGLLARCLDEGKRIEVTTGAVRDVACDAIREAADFLVRVEAATPSLAADLRAVAGTAALERLRNLYNGFCWFNLLLERVPPTFGFSLGDLVVRGRTGYAHHRDLVSFLEEVLGAHQRAEFEVMADLLEQNFRPLAALWTEILEALGRRVAPG